MWTSYTIFCQEVVSKPMKQQVQKLALLRCWMNAKFLCSVPAGLFPKWWEKNGDNVWVSHKTKLEAIEDALNQIV